MMFCFSNNWFQYLNEIFSQLLQLLTFCPLLVLDDNLKQTVQTQLVDSLFADLLKDVKM